MYIGFIASGPKFYFDSKANQIISKHAELCSAINSSTAQEMFWNHSTSIFEFSPPLAPEIE